MRDSASPSARSPVRRAFTMMEVLVVIVILSILLALITNVVKRLQVQAEIEKTKATMVIVMKAIERYYDEKRVFPERPQDMMSVDSCKEILSNSPVITSNGDAMDGFGKVMTYEKTGGPGKRPRLVSSGPDQQPNTKDDITYP